MRKIYRCLQYLYDCYSEGKSIGADKTKHMSNEFNCTLASSNTFVNITILPQSTCNIILQNSFTVLSWGPTKRKEINHKTNQLHLSRNIEFTD